MQKRYFYALFVLCLFWTASHAQEKKFEVRVKEISENFELITREEKRILKEKIDEINDQLQKDEITSEEAEVAKQKQAAIHAKNIEDRVTKEKQLLDQLVKEKVAVNLLLTNVVVDTLVVNSDTIKSTTKIRLKDFGRSLKRTTNETVFAMGLNNLMTDGALANSDYRYWGSHFYEWGFTYTTRLRKENNLLHLKYGLSMMYNNLRVTDNRYFVKNDEETILEVHDKHLRDSRFRNLNLVVPVHLEFDFSPTTYAEDGVKKVFSKQRKFRMGIGGYAGFNVKTKQIVKYKEDGKDYKIKDKGDFRTNDFVYGVSAYVGYRSLSLYTKYDISPLFKSNNIDQNNISMGLRVDLY